MMSITRVLSAIALSLVPSVAAAQVTPAPTPPAAPATTQLAAKAPDEAAEGPITWSGKLDFGVRGTTTEGDAARYERYRDLGDGLFLETVKLFNDHEGWLLNLDADHVGRRDQRFVGRVVRPGKLKAFGMWDQIPMLLSRTTRTLFSGIGTDVLAIDDAIQQQVQNQPATLTALFNQSSQQFDMRTRRHVGSGGIQYEATKSVTLTADARHTNREGTIPFGGSFGHGSLVELPLPTNHDLSEVNAGAEYVRDPLLLRAGYSGSWFHNDFTSVTFDNPYRLTDTPATPGRGRLSVAPSNSFVGVNGLVSAKLPYHTRATAYGAINSLQDAGDPIMPQTINSSFATAPIARSTVEGDARTTAVNLTFVSRPVQQVDVDVRYKSYDYDNRTPEFPMTQRVSFDNTPAAVNPPVFSEPFGVIRHTFDADFRYLPAARTSAGIGVTRLTEERSHRIFESTTENTVRVSFDSMSQSWLALRTKYEHGQRRGEGIEEGELELAAIGEQPGMRHFDIASRDRDRVTVLASVTPTGDFTANVSLAAGKDDYIQSEFGLRDNTHRVFGAGADYVAANIVTLGLSYSYEKYTALSRSRQANPGEQFNDPSRNWATDSSDRAHTFLINADVARIANKVDLRFSYDFSHTRARYDYITGPVADRTLPEEVIVPTTLPTPTELPPTLSELQRGSADAMYVLTSRLSVGISYWYEKYRVKDFTLDIDANPELVRGQALLIGYLYRPYTANTVWGRVVYHW
jgi:MtrB/PioB family decaheme-associated outer membrane protein